MFPDCKKRLTLSMDELNQLVDLLQVHLSILIFSLEK